MSFNNFGRELYNEAINKVARDVLLKKKKDLERLMKGKTSEEVISYVRGVAKRSGRISKFEANKQALGFALNYESGMHYFVDFASSSISIGAGVNSAKIIHEVGNDYTIEFTVTDELTMLGRYIYLGDDAEDCQIFIDGKRVYSCIVLFGKVYYPTAKSVPVTQPITIAYLLEDTAYFASCGSHPLTINCARKSVKFKFGEHMTEINILEASEFLEACFDTFLLCAKSVYDVQKSVKVRKRRNVSNETSTSSSTQKNVSVPSVVYEDKLVTLQRYIYEYEPSIKRESKGGHHASPIEHDRKDFYRKSRGRGDYELVDGKFVYVGNKEGHYSYVPKTHVNGKDGKKPVLIYKA